MPMRCLPAPLRLPRSPADTLVRRGQLMRMNDNCTDVVRISAVRRPLRTELSPERIAEVRRRIREGVYNSGAMADEVAWRILRSGDV